METQITDQELYKMARIYGANAILWRRKFMALLPEISKRKIYEKKGFNSIYEFSFKLAGLSADQVKLALNLNEKFLDKPALKGLLQNGEVSINKLSRVVSIATPENQEELAELVKILPKSALETLVRDEKFAVKDLENSNQNGFPKPLFEVKSLPGQTELKLSEEVAKRLLALQNKGIDLNQILTELLDKRELEIAEEKAQISQKIENQQGGRGQKPSRYIPARVRKIIQKEHGTKCSIPNCNKPAEQLHHTQMFALSHAHNPIYLAPLCKNHHTLAHSINLKVQEKRLLM
ncbi:MAG: hypothetical protein WC897_00090 [Candidatus Gracilibacteria bacterium]